MIEKNDRKSIKKFLWVLVVVIISIIYLIGRIISIIYLIGRAV